MGQTNAQALGGLPPGTSGVGLPADAVTGDPAPTAPPTVAGPPRTNTPPAVGDLPPLPDISMEHHSVGNLSRQCDCVTPRLSATQEIFVEDIRDISNEFCKGGDAQRNIHGLSNMSKLLLSSCQPLYDILQAVLHALTESTFCVEVVTKMWMPIIKLNVMVHSSYKAVRVNLKSDVVQCGPLDSFLVRLLSC